jgi:hypothetical protein
MIRSVYKWDNSMVMVFDDDGQQLPEYQGHVARVRARILRDAGDDAEFFSGVWRAHTVQPIEREDL